MLKIRYYSLQSRNDPYDFKDRGWNCLCVGWSFDFCQVGDRPVQTLYNYVLWDLAFGSNVIITCTHMHQRCDVFCLERSIAEAISALFELCKPAFKGNLYDLAKVIVRKECAKKTKLAFSYATQSV